MSVCGSLSTVYAYLSVRCPAPVGRGVKCTRLLLARTCPLPPVSCPLSPVYCPPFPVPCSQLSDTSRRFDQLVRDSPPPPAAAATASDETSPDGYLEEAATAQLDGGVLDAKWSTHPADDGAAVLACVSSTGRLVLYSLSSGAEDVVGERVELRQVASSDVDDSLLLSLDWSRGTVSSAKVLCAVYMVYGLYAVCFMAVRKVRLYAVWSSAWMDGLE